MEAMGEPDRQVYLLGQRLASLARLLRGHVEEGMALTQILASQEPDERADIAWLGENLLAEMPVNAEAAAPADLREPA
jgi:primosomal protein N''